MVKFEQPRIVIAGAGSIGCFVGGLLVAGGHDVVFLGRQRMAQAIKRSGLTLTSFSDLDVRIDPQYVDIKDGAEALAGAEVVLVCVKSSATAEMAQLIAHQVQPGATVVSLQNGVRNAEILREYLPEHDVRAGMVPFNVVQMSEGHFHQGTSGDIVIEAGLPDMAKLLTTDRMTIHASADIVSVQWGKLLVNLNNALNAISDLPIVEQLGHRSWRLQFAKLITEALAVLKAEGIEPKPPSPVPAWLIPHILRLPTFLFRAVARQMLAMDPNARTSMWQDLQQGRKTEIDELQGEIIRLGKKHGIPTPENERIMQEIRVREVV